MKVVNAVWEERNLGVKCHEITIEPGDEPTLVKDDLASAEAEYTVVRVPVACPEWHRALETQGYTFVEAAVTCAHETAELPPLLPKQRRLLESCSCVRLQQDELPLLESHMHKGLFTTDRIALDPHFSVGQANRRYLLWIKDEFARGGLLYWVEAGGQKVGFFGLKPAGEQVLATYLSAIFPEFSGCGYGTVARCLDIKIAEELGAVTLETTFSSNNPAVASIFMKLGYRLKATSYIFVKHCWGTVDGSGQKR